MNSSKSEKYQRKGLTVIRTWRLYIHSDLGQSIKLLNSIFPSTTYMCILLVGDCLFAKTKH